LLFTPKPEDVDERWMIIRGILPAEASECSALVATIAVFGHWELQAYFQFSVLTVT
jgi:hypothetical protein